MLQDFLVGAITSVMTGVGLWAVLPRGVALTRAPRVKDLAVERLYDTWEVKNDSPVPVEFTSVAMQSPETWNKQSNKLEWRELPAQTHDLHGIDVCFDEEQLFYRLTEGVGRWRGFVLPPGDTMQVTVMNNHDLRIKYRRAGWTGVFERRQIMIAGGV